VLVTTDLAYQNAEAAGTGIVLTSTGEVLTNNHVIRGATTIKIVIPATHKSYSADVIGYDIADDIALLQVTGAPKLATVTRGDSSKLRLGQFTRAVGNANGGGKLVLTTGTVTGLNRTITIGNEDGTTSKLTGLIQTSAHLVPGDSGGPLLDVTGRVIGVDAAGSANYQIEKADGYAIPINQAYALVKQMRAGVESSLVHVGKTAFLGVTIAAGSLGLVIGTIIPGSAAANAGLQPGNIFTALDGVAVQSLDDVRRVLFTHHPGDTITVDYVDSFGQPATTQLTLGDGPPQ
jgi:S1-C subfamily serine protease